MVVEMKRIIDLSDIKAIVFECKNKTCHSRVSRPPEKVNEVPHMCGACTERWRSPGTEESVVIAFTEALRTLRAIANTMPFAVRLEFDEVVEDT